LKILTLRLTVLDRVWENDGIPNTDFGAI